MSFVIPVLSRTPNLCRELSKALPKATFHQVESPNSDSHFNNSEVLICDFDLLGPYLYTLPHAKWVQGTWAGVDKLVPFIQDGKAPSFQLTRFSGRHFGRIMSEYVIASIVNHERNFLQIKSQQEKSAWNREGKISEYRIIADLTVGVLGFGSIGSQIGRTLHLFGAKVLAYGRNSKLQGTEDYGFVSKYYTREMLPLLMEASDYVISVLPNTPNTRNLLDEEVLQHGAGCLNEHITL